MARECFEAILSMESFDSLIKSSPFPFVFLGGPLFFGIFPSTSLCEPQVAVDVEYKCLVSMP